ncbi:hypothetical protein QWI17_15240 [Gilvimarinus sp. SDUM040013]|uniref:Uncharacterized protein n=1 Tax=Gilvimarinus gilvus TaxID=3058038 RepID=A0ABU4S1F5_9GAMM|nr:hypothetical protein [Gilvimarinus sp. SDUM040013]MDO3387196.1 hypothetical protein [Gilvimarinus sp. SDUM040013]MDX6850759.1 hypothetical protein [Gilvimarinus sp. SDUM040013]
MTKSEYLNELKAHDWTYEYASGQSYYKGRDNAQRLKAIADTAPELAALYSAYSAFVWSGSDEPTVTESTRTNATARAVMVDAWDTARRAAKRYGHPAKDFIAQALRQAWAKVKAARLTSYSSNRRASVVYTVCIDERLNRNTKLRDQLAVEAYFSDYSAAQAARALLAQAFTKPFIKTESTCFA